MADTEAEQNNNEFYEVEVDEIAGEEEEAGEGEEDEAVLADLKAKLAEIEEETKKYCRCTRFCIKSQVTGNARAC